MADPSFDEVYNNTAAMRVDPRLPGLGGFISAWTTLQNFTGSNAVQNYQEFLSIAEYVGSYVQ